VNLTAVYRILRAAALEQHDGFLIAATNHSDHIDQAIWRRFDIHISLELPGQEERERILVAADLVTSETRKSFAIIASMAGAPIGVVEDLDIDDFERLSEVAAPLMGKSAMAVINGQGKGEGGSAIVAVATSRGTTPISETEEMEWDRFNAYPRSVPAAGACLGLAQ
jgi:SpoVK/Ycf46/Vps4 family AAA+-type ATPase